MLKVNRFFSDIKFKILIVVLYIISTLFLIWKAQYGCSGGDEGMYLAIPYRIIQGDCFFKDEWIFLQLGELFLLPIMRIYFLFFKNTDSIFLKFRYIYIVFKLIISIIIIITFYRYKYFALCTSLIYYLFSVSNIMMLSYNTFGYSMIILSFLMIAPVSKIKDYRYFLSGIFFALACTCQVTILFFIIPIFIVVFIILLIKKYNLKHFCLFVFGCIVMAVITLLYFHTTTGLYNVFKYLPYSFTIDKLFHNSSRSLIYFILNNIRYYLGYRMWDYNWSFFFCFSLLYVVYLVNTYQYIKFTYLAYNSNKSNYFYCVSFVLISLLIIVYSFYHPNFIIFPFVLFSLYIYKYLDVGEKRVLIFAIIFSIIEVFGFYHSENYGAVTSFAVMPLSLVNVLYIKKIFNDLFCGLKKFIVVNIFIAFICLLLSRVIRVYACNSIFELDTKFDSGIFKGIYTTKTIHNKYNAYIDEIEALKLSCDNSILIFNNPNYSWMPLCTKARLCQYSPYLFSVEDNIVYLLQEYYKEFPNKFPEFVYITDTTNFTKNDVYDKLMDILLINQYTVINESEYSIILKKNN